MSSFPYTPATGKIGVFLPGRTWAKVGVDCVEILSLFPVKVPKGWGGGSIIVIQKTHS